MWIDDAIRKIKYTLSCSGKVYIIGNGGSAAMASHFASELVGSGIPCISLTDPAVMTAIANDKGYDMVFASQVWTLGEPNDVLIVLTTSGKSRNIDLAITAAKMNDMLIVEPPVGKNTQYMQERQLRGLHIIWQALL